MHKKVFPAFKSCCIHECAFVSYIAFSYDVLQSAELSPSRQMAFKAGNTCSFVCVQSSQVQDNIPVLFMLEAFFGMAENAFDEVEWIRRMTALGD